MERVSAWREGLAEGPGQYRDQLPPVVKRPSVVLDLTSESSNAGGSPDSVRIVEQQPRPPKPQQQLKQSSIQSMFMPRYSQPKQQPLRPVENNHSFASSSAAWQTGDSKRLQGMPRIPKQQPRYELDDSASPSISNSASSFAPSEKASPKFGFASSAAAFRTSSSSSTGAIVAGPSLTTKQRITAALQEETRAKGVPFAVPANPPYKRPIPPAPKLPQSDDPLDEANLPQMGFEDGLDGEDQEAALKELIGGMVDLDLVKDGDNEVPSSLLCTLLPHQSRGFHWLLSRETGKKRGGILADDMGLGKTVQMLSLILANPPLSKEEEEEGGRKVVRDKEGRRCKTTLIITPVALMQQWKTEIETKSDAGLKVCIHHGTGKKTARELRRYDIVLTSYNTAAAEWVDPKPPRKKGGKKGAEEGDSDDAPSKSTASKEKGALFGVDRWYRIILDEAHSIKGRTTKAHKACCDLVGHYRWCLSGTPIQNGVLDLFALFEFLGKIVNPLHTFSEFKAKISDPLKNKRTKIAMTRLAVVLKAVMLRRTKGMMIDGKPLLVLPKREIICVKGPFLDDDEQAFYKAVEEKMSLTMNAFLKAGTAMSNYTSVLILLLRMRQACSHPSLITGSTTLSDREALDAPDPAALTAATPEEDDLSSLLTGLGGLSVKGGRQCALCDKASRGPEEAYCRECYKELGSYGNLLMSTKIRRMLRVLEEIRKEGKGRKTIVFSQFTSMFNIIEPFLQKGGYKYVRYDGKLNAVQKEAVLKKIREDDRTTIILLSLKCGSVGLNLTACSRVILLDMWWNPAIEAQSFDRAHRMGQTEDVKIYKITVDNTIEDRILTLQEEKAAIATAALEGGDMTKANKLSMKDMLYLFRGDGAGSSSSSSKRKGVVPDDEAEEDPLV